MKAPAGSWRCALAMCESHCAAFAVNAATALAIGTLTAYCINESKNSVR